MDENNQIRFYLQGGFERPRERAYIRKIYIVLFCLEGLKFQIRPGELNTPEWHMAQSCSIQKKIVGRNDTCMAQTKNVVIRRARSIFRVRVRVQCSCGVRTVFAWFSYGVLSLFSRCPYGVRSLLVQGRFEIADICLLSAFSKARSRLRKPGFFSSLLQGKTMLG